MIRAFIFDLSFDEIKESKLLSKAKEVGVETVLLSTKEDENGLLDLVLSPSSVKRSEPHPDILLEAFIRLGMDSREALVFTESEDGIKTALRANTNIIAIENDTLDREKAKNLGVSVVLSTLSSFPDFASLDDLDAIYRQLRRIGKDAKKYGANWITPLERKLPMEVVEKKAIEEARKAMYNAYAPYSKFKVGAALLSSQSGRIYSGCNVENASFGATICAERNAITTAITAEGAIGIDLLVVSSMVNPPAIPCAICLQVMSEFIRPETPIILISNEGTMVRYQYKDLLPHPFDFGDNQ